MALQGVAEAQAETETEAQTQAQATEGAQVWLCQPVARRTGRSLAAGNSSRSRNRRRMTGLEILELPTRYFNWRLKGHTVASVSLPHSPPPLPPAAFFSLKWEALAEAATWRPLPRLTL